MLIVLTVIGLVLPVYLRTGRNAPLGSLYCKATERPVGTAEYLTIAEPNHSPSLSGKEHILTHESQTHERPTALNRERADQRLKDSLG